MTFSAAAGRACEPNDPLLRLWKAATALREHRGDGHVAAPLTAVISPCEALVPAAAAGAPGVSPGVGGLPLDRARSATRSTQHPPPPTAVRRDDPTAIPPRAHPAASHRSRRPASWRC